MSKAEEDVVAYRCLYNKIYDLQMTDEIIAGMLPKELVIKPGKYRVFDKVYCMNEEGLYRFVQPFGTSEQRIVYGGGAVKDLESYYLQRRGF